MTIRHAIYDLSDGRIIRVFTGDEIFLAQNTFSMEPGVTCSAVPLDSGDDSVYRVDILSSPHAAVLKTPINFSIDKLIIAVNGIDYATISNIPSNCVVYFDGESYSLDNNSIEFSADVPGEYEVVLKHPLYLNTVVTIIAQ